MTCLDKQGHPKKPYPNKTASERAIRNRTEANPTLDLRSYRCPKCSSFHLTHSPERVEGEAA